MTQLASTLHRTLSDPRAGRHTDPKAEIEALRLLSYRYVRLARFTDARPLLEIVLLHDPHDSTMRLFLILTLLGLDRPAEALEQLSSGDMHDSGEAHLLRGRALANLGLTQQAQAEYARYRNYRERSEYLP
jgi:hypothetical protein